MSVFNNKHIILAAIVTPVLALLSFWAAGFLVEDQSLMAEEGESYPLMAMSNCRYASGRCTLRNGDIKLHLSINDNLDQRRVLELHTEYPLQSVFVSLGERGDEELMPVALSPNRDRLVWKYTLDEREVTNPELRIAAQMNNSLYYASTGTAFFTDDVSSVEAITRSKL